MAAFGLTGTFAWSDAEAQQATRITHGPILGRLGAHEIGIWARTHRPGTFRVRYGLGPDRMDMLSDAVTTLIEKDNTGWAHIKDLQADTEHFYELSVEGSNATMHNRRGSFRTLPDPDEMRDEKQNPRGLFNFSFEYACGNSQSSNGLGPALPTFRTMLDKIAGKIDFWDSLGKPVFVLTGDLHNSFAIKVSDRVWEFASGPHNSRNHSLSAEAGRPPIGIYNSRGRPVEIRWSTSILDDVPGGLRYRPVYTVVQVNNVFNNPVEPGKDRWVAFPRPQVVFQYYDGLTGDLLYAESILAEVD